MRIIGIDPGTLRLGYGVVDWTSPARLTYVECGVIAAPARQSRDERLLTIGRGLRDLFVELSPHAIAIEQAFYGKNIQSTLALGEARGVAIFVAREHGLPVVGYAPAHVKQSVVGHGRATKEQIAFLVRSLLSMKRTPEPDAADALAIAVCHAREHHSPLAAARAQTKPRANAKAHAKDKARDNE